MFSQKSNSPNQEVLSTGSNRQDDIELDPVNAQNDDDRNLSNSNSTTEEDTETRRTYTGTISEAEDVNRIVQLPTVQPTNKTFLQKYFYIIAGITLIFIGVVTGILIYVFSHGDSKYNKYINEPFLRLPQTIRPIKYDLTLQPNIEQGPYSGNVNITINATVPFTEVVLHSQNLSIEHVILQSANADYSTVDISYFLHSSNRTSDLKEHIIITTETVTAKGLYYLTIKFNGDLRNKIVGFYRSMYKNKKGNIRKIATSKFEPTYARQAFPCFDEPAFKAKFHVHIEKPKSDEYKALSNFRQAAEEKTDNGIMVHFEETDIVMSTYLACFIVCDFNYTANDFKNKGGENDLVPFRVFATPQQLDKTQYAAELGKKIMEFYVGYFNIPYPLPKLDMIAIPDFVSGAMEHWGLVTYRETALLYNEAYHSAGNKQRVATVVGHELAHSWFGNLVTMSWWDNLWLNEGFASYIEYKGVDHAEPTWQMMQQFLIEDLHGILEKDAKISSHPIIQKVETPDQITEVFDPISYAKGASVLRMLENVVGPINFQKGVTDYLNKFAFGNAVSADLIEAIDKHFPNHGITEFLETFTTQTGYPLVTVEYTDDKNKLKLTQKRFLMGSNEKFNNTWKIPIRYRVVGDTSESQVYWFDADKEHLMINKPKDKIIKFNPEQVGFYRVNYQKDYWDQLIENYPKLSIADRTHLLEESFSLAEAGELPYETPLNLAKQLVNEFEYIPWAAVKIKIMHLKTMLGSTIDNFIRDISKNAYIKLSWEEKSTDGHLVKLARGELLDIACTFNMDGCIVEASKRFKAWFEGNTNLSPDIRAIVYKYGVQNSNEDEYNAVLERYVQEIDAGEKQKLMLGLANVDNEDLLKKFISWIWDEKKVRTQDYLNVLQWIAANPKGRPLVWDYVTRNWEAIVDRYTLNDRNLGKMIIGITKEFTTPEDYNNMKEFYAKYPEAGAGERARAQALENVMNNIQWNEQHKEIVEKWLSHYCINCR